MNEKVLKQIRNVLTIILTLLILAVLKITSSISIDIFLALFLFLLFLPIMNAFDKSKIPSFFSLLIIIFLIIAVVSATVLFVFYAVDQLVRLVPAYVNKIDQFDELVIGIIGRWTDLPEGFSLMGSLNIDWFNGVAMPLLKSVSASTVSIFSDAMVVILMGIFLLLERNTVIPKLESIIHGESNKKISSIITRLNSQVSKYLGIKFVVSFFTGLCFYGIGLAVNLDGALIIGVLTMVLNFIPTFGSIIITVLTIAIAVLQFLPNWQPIIIVAVGTIATQQIIGNIIDPRLQGNKLNLSPFVILVSLSIFGYIFGIVGMFLAVPLLSVMQIIFINIESTKPIAYILSSGHSIRKMKNKKGGEGEQLSFDDFIFS